jgi:CHAD domain-containing protein
MITLEQLTISIQNNHKARIDHIFFADDYEVKIRYSDKLHISVVLEALANYTKDDKSQRLHHYIRLNSKVLGYTSSSLAYNKNNEVLVQRWVDKFTSIADILGSIEDLLFHADILTQAQY